MGHKGITPIIIIVFSLLVLLLTACGEGNQGDGGPFASGGKAAAATVPGTQSNPVGTVLAGLPQIPAATPEAAVAPTPTPEPTATAIPPTATAVPTATA